ncbi:MAG: insulinase family protein [Muribaculaceae bacterium]|nr:insulinase family protein [Muribaculaceae bacterium]
MGGTLLTATLTNGLRCIARQSPGATECCGLTFNSGSRDEVVDSDHGLAHFVEHTIFKGTSRRTGSYVLNRMESVGAELNAFTTKEETTVYSLMPAGNFRRAARLIGELASDSAFPERGLQLEREVICDEIDSYLDSPAEAAYDLFDEMIFAGNPLAHNILGRKQTVMDFTDERCRRYLRERFTADNGVFFYLGPEDPQKVFREAEKAFGALPLQAVGSGRTRPQLCPPEVAVQDNGSHQAHTVMGVEIGGLHAPDRHVTALAVNILGGPGMNALLNLALRERNGLVYTVEASTALYSDCGLMTIYFGCDHQDLERCRRIVGRTLDGLASKPLSERSLAAYKRQYLGQVTLGQDNREQTALSSGRAILHGLQPPSITRTAEKISAITPAELRLAAEKLASSTLRTLTLV